MTLIFKRCGLMRLQDQEGTGVDLSIKSVSNDVFRYRPQQALAAANFLLLIECVTTTCGRSS